MRQLARHLVLVAMVGIVGLGMGTMSLLPGVHLAESARRAYPCDQLPGRAVSSLGAHHLSYLGERHRPYNSSPPTSGPHMPWLITAGVYDAPIPDEYQVHLLEHGKVLVQFPRDMSARTLERLERFGRRRTDVVVAPSERVEHGIALTAWQRIEWLPRYDEERIGRFIERLAGRYDHGWVSHAGGCADEGP